MSNKELAEKYFQVVSTTSFDISGVKSYERQKRRIEDSPIDISEYYREHKTLEKLNVEGIGKQTIRKLESILRVGAEETSRQIQEEKDKKLKERIIFGSRPRKISRKDYFD